MENTLFSKENGGQMGKSIMPELEKLALDNVSFSNRQAGLGGALPATGTTWTVGAMMAQSGGVPLKSSVLGQDHNSMGLYKQFLPGAYTLGDILHTHGYNQTFIMGSEASFGGRDKLLSQHGSYAIHDYSYAKKSGDISSDYGVWWGYEDKKLLDFAKTELGRLSQEDKPFNLQLLTVDTHFTDGWLDPSCETAYQNQYDNVHACSSKMVAEFVAWIQEQSYADDTTIIITGDHLGMQTSYYDDKITEPNYSRTVYNVFINPAVRPESSQGRLFSSFDMYPSTLAAMGVTIAGDRLALGTNLFSGQPTLVEQYGTIDALNNILSQRSEFYEKQIFLK
jgi:phosphoglycerol transferase